MRITPAVRVLNGRLGIDVDHARLELLGNLGEGVRELLRSGNGQRGRIRRLLSLLAFHSIGDNVPIRIPTASVARIVKVYAQRLALRRTQKALSRESISTS
jgi:hypothetical protein